MAVLNFKSVEKNQFQFQGIDPDSELEKDANRRLIEMMDYAPPGVTPKARVQRADDGYLATVVFSSTFQAFYARAFGLRLDTAIDRVLHKIYDQLYNWRLGRVGGRPTRHARYRGDLSRPRMAA